MNCIHLKAKRVRWQAERRLLQALVEPARRLPQQLQADCPLVAGPPMATLQRPQAEQGERRQRQAAAGRWAEGAHYWRKCRHRRLAGVWQREMLMGSMRRRQRELKVLVKEAVSVTSA